MTELTDQIKLVAEARGWAKVAKNEVDESRRAWEDQNEQILSSLVGSNEVVQEAEAIRRELTLKAYAETRDKAPAVGVGIREVTKLDYDKKVAFDWAKHHEMALQLDKRAFEKIVKADTPDFVTITQEPQATIATNLEIV